MMEIVIVMEMVMMAGDDDVDGDGDDGDGVPYMRLSVRAHHPFRLSSGRYSIELQWDQSPSSQNDRESHSKCVEFSNRQRQLNSIMQWPSPTKPLGNRRSFHW